MRKPVLQPWELRGTVIHLEEETIGYSNYVADDLLTNDYDEDDEMEIEKVIECLDKLDYELVRIHHDWSGTVIYKLEDGKVLLNL